MRDALEWSTLRDPAALAALEDPWWALWQRCPRATPFQSPAWILPWWSAFAPGELFVRTAWDAGRLVALAPLYLDDRGCLRPIGTSLSDYEDILIDPIWIDRARDLLASRVGRANWAVCEFSELAPGSQALSLSVPTRAREFVERGSACPVLRLPDSPERLPGRFPPRKRRAVCLARNRAARLGPVEILSGADDAAALTMFDSLVRLHGARWRERGRSGVMADARVLEFHRQAVPRLLQRGLLRMCELRISHRPAAVYYGFHHSERAYGYLMGFDPAFAFASPGTILLCHAMEQAICDGAQEFHFLRGREAYKYGWGATDRWNCRRIIQRKVARAGAA